MRRNNKDKLREWQRRQEEEQGRLAIETPRPFRTDLSVPGIGRLRAQFVLVPSWEPLECWEIREQSELRVFHSQGVSEYDELVVGYTPLSVAPEALAAIVESFEALTLPPAVKQEPYDILDGTRIEVGFGGGFDCSSRFRWVKGYAPAAWARLEDLALSAIALFRTVAEVGEAD